MTRFRPGILFGTLTLALLMALSGCSMSPESEAGPRSAPETLQATLDKWWLRGDIPAVVVGITHSDGRTWLGVSGTPERAGPVAVTTDARFRIASITKVFVAVV
ncbi:MAG TPA: serine hydrolase, partial [Propionibacteriaceae bacterium]|nr:serine hydrolase [Propionibacteriaceae bacterium]